MATGLLERTQTTATNSTLKAYGKLTGEVEPAVMTEEQKALKFNSHISDNYQKLINPDLKKAEEIADTETEQKEEYSEPVYQTPEAYAYAMLYPNKQPRVTDFVPSYATATQTPTFTHQRVTEDLFRADSPINRTAFKTYEPVPETTTEQQENLATGYKEETSEDLKPTATTIQYQNELYRNDKQQTPSKEKSRFAITAKGKVLMCVYAVVVAVILALIVINTRVLGNLDSSIAAHEKALASYRTQYSALQEDIKTLTDENSIVQRAEEMGMIR